MQLFPAQNPPTRFNTFFLQISTNFNLILSIFGDKNRHLGGKGDPENVLGGPRPQKKMNSGVFLGPGVDFGGHFESIFEAKTRQEIDVKIDSEKSSEFHEKSTPK